MANDRQVIRLPGHRLLLLLFKKLHSVHLTKKFPKSTKMKMIQSQQQKIYSTTSSQKRRIMATAEMKKNVHQQQQHVNGWICRGIYLFLSCWSCLKPIFLSLMFMTTFFCYVDYCLASTATKTSMNPTTSATWATIITSTPSPFFIKSNPRFINNNNNHNGDFYNNNKNNNNRVSSTTSTTMATISSNNSNFDTRKATLLFSSNPLINNINHNNNNNSKNHSQRSQQHSKHFATVASTATGHQLNRLIDLPKINNRTTTTTTTNINSNNKDSTDNNDLIASDDEERNYYLTIEDDQLRTPPTFSLSSLSTSLNSIQQSPPPASQSSNTSSIFNCPEQFGYFADGKDCSRYYVCVFGDPLHETCTGGLYFSSELQTCDWPQNVDCSTTTTTTMTINGEMNDNKSGTTLTTLNMGTSGGNQQHKSTNVVSSSSSDHNNNGYNGQNDIQFTAQINSDRIELNKTMIIQNNNNNNNEDRFQNNNDIINNSNNNNIKDEDLDDFGLGGVDGGIESGSTEQTSIDFDYNHNDLDNPDFDESIASFVDTNGDVYVHDTPNGLYSLMERANGISDHDKRIYLHSTSPTSSDHTTRKRLRQQKQRQQQQRRQRQRHRTSSKQKHSKNHVKPINSRGGNNNNNGNLKYGTQHRRRQPQYRMMRNNISDCTNTIVNNNQQQHNHKCVGGKKDMANVSSSSNSKNAVKFDDDENGTAVGYDGSGGGGGVAGGMVRTGGEKDFYEEDEEDAYVDDIDADDDDYDDDDDDDEQDDAVDEVNVDEDRDDLDNNSQLSHSGQQQNERRRQNQKLQLQRRRKPSPPYPEHLLPRLNIVKKQLKDFEDEHHILENNSSNNKDNNINETEQDETSNNNNIDRIKQKLKTALNSKEDNRNSKDLINSHNKHGNNGNNNQKNGPETTITFVADTNNDDYLNKRDLWNYEASSKSLSTLSSPFQQQPPHQSQQYKASSTRLATLFESLDLNNNNNQNVKGFKAHESRTARIMDNNQNNHQTNFIKFNHGTTSSTGSNTFSDYDRYIFQPRMKTFFNQESILPVFQGFTKSRFQSNHNNNNNNTVVDNHRRYLLQSFPIPLYSSSYSNNNNNNDIIKQHPPQQHSINRGSFTPSSDSTNNIKQKESNSQIIFYSYRDQASSKTLEKLNRIQQAMMNHSTMQLPLQQSSSSSSSSSGQHSSPSQHPMSPPPPSLVDPRPKTNGMEVFTIRSEDFLPKNTSMQASQINEKRIKLPRITGNNNNGNGNNNNSNNNNLTLSADGHEFRRSYRFDNNRMSNRLLLNLQANFASNKTIPSSSSSNVNVSPTNLIKTMIPTEKPMMIVGNYSMVKESINYVNVQGANDGQHQQCDPKLNCRLPKCFCPGVKAPYGFKRKEIPQMILLTFDDAVNDVNFPLYQEIFDRRTKPSRTNPNGCPIKATFFVSHEWTDYGKVQTLYARGHEIASHSITYGEKFSTKEWYREIAGQREILHRYGGIPKSEIRGMRAPFLQIGGDEQFQMLMDANMTYDSSISIFDNAPPYWPYTLDFGIQHDCMITPCPTRSYPGLWEIGLIMWHDLIGGGRCTMGNSCTSPSDEKGVFELIMTNFKRHYETNRAPFGLFYQSNWFTNPHHKAGFLRFIDEVLKLGDVYFVTNWQLLNWIQNPINLDRIDQFEPWQCQNDIRKPSECLVPNICHVKFQKGDKIGSRFFKTCQRCPNDYPWINNIDQLMTTSLANN